MRWYVTAKSTKQPDAHFRTKREAIEYGKKITAGTGSLFIVWKGKKKSD